MRILLINISKPTEVRIPQGLLYLASTVYNAGHEAIIHDEAFTSNPQESFEQIISYNADVVGFSVYSLPWQLKRAEQLSKAVKTTTKKPLIIWGGWHATLYPKHCILNESVDVIIRGPGERPVVEILKALQQCKSLENIRGLVFRENNQIIETGPECMDSEFLYPPLNFNLIRLKDYLKKHDRGKGILQYITTRGCNARCRFCIMANVFEGRLFQKPQYRIYHELKYLLRHHNISAIHFSDDNTFRNEQEALQFCDIINQLTNRRGIPWRCATRINTLSNLSADTYQKLVRSGSEGVVVGIESGVDRVLKLMGKGITVSQIERSLRCLADNGLSSNLFSFLFNFTGETKKEALKTLRLVRKTRWMLPGSTIMLHVYFPGASDSSTVPLNLAKSLPFSEIFERYYEEHIRNYRVGRTPINVLRYYLNASEVKVNQRSGKFLLLRKVQQKTILFRIKYGIFALPFEYYISSIVVKRIRKAWIWVKSRRI